MMKVKSSFQEAQNKSSSESDNDITLINSLLSLNTFNLLVCTISKCCSIIHKGLLEVTSEISLQVLLELIIPLLPSR